MAGFDEYARGGQREKVLTNDKGMNPYSHNRMIERMMSNVAKAIDDKPILTEKNSEASWDIVTDENWGLRVEFYENDES